MKKIRFKTLSIYLGGYLLLAILSFTIITPYVRNEYQLKKILEIPIGVTISTRDNGNVYVTRRYYSMGIYLITDIGNVRLIVPGESYSTYSGVGSGALLVGHSRNSGFSVSGLGGTTFITSYENGGSRCSIGELFFTIKNGILSIQDEEFDIINGPPKAIVFHGDLTIRKIRDLELAK